jgi:hypothetical protein
MCGKPLFIVKSSEASAPSDLKRTDWLSYDPDDERRFRDKLEQGLREIQDLIEYEFTLLEVSLEAATTDCAVAFERANKGFLLSGEDRFVDAAGRILDCLEGVERSIEVGDLDRLRSEIKTFVRQANAARE